MNYREFLNKLDSLDRAIKNGKTGSAEELANRLHISRRTLFNYLEILKDGGAIIKFCRHRRTFYFEK